jgi:hypothetical protein
LQLCLRANNGKVCQDQERNAQREFDTPLNPTGLRLKSLKARWSPVCRSRQQINFVDPDFGANLGARAAVYNRTRSVAVGE